MLSVAALVELAEHIDHHLRRKMSLENGVDPELTLFEKISFRERSVASGASSSSSATPLSTSLATSSSSSSALTAEKEDEGKSKDKGKTKVKNRERSRESQQPQAKPSSASAPAQVASDSLEPLAYAELHDWEKLQAIFPKIQLKKVTEVNDRSTRASRKPWSLFLAQKESDFSADIDNIFKHDPTELRKLLVVARFKRQLLLIAEYAKGCYKNESFVCEEEESIDAWIVNQVNQSAKEALTLLSRILEDSGVSFTSLLGGHVTAAASVGRSEDLVTVCQNVMRAFLKFCKDSDDQRHVEKGSFRSMVDTPYKYSYEAYTEASTPVHPLISANKEIVWYILENLYEDEEAKLRHVNLTHYFQTAESKRQHVITLLRELDAAWKIYSNDSGFQINWNLLFAKIHEQSRIGLGLGKGLGRTLSEMLNTVSQSVISSDLVDTTQRLDQMYHRLHFLFLQATPRTETELLQNHSFCQFVTRPANK